MKLLESRTLSQNFIIEYLNEKSNTFNIGKYAKTLNYWSSYALVDSMLESVSRMAPC